MNVTPTLKAKQPEINGCFPNNHLAMFSGFDLPFGIRYLRHPENFRQPSVGTATHGAGLGAALLPGARRTKEVRTVDRDTLGREQRSHMSRHSRKLTWTLTMGCLEDGFPLPASGFQGPC